MSSGRRPWRRAPLAWDVPGTTSGTGSCTPSSPRGAPGACWVSVLDPSVACPPSPLPASHRLPAPRNARSSVRIDAHGTAANAAPQARRHRPASSRSRSASSAPAPISASRHGRRPGGRGTGDTGGDAVGGGDGARRAARAAAVATAATGDRPGRVALAAGAEGPTASCPTTRAARPSPAPSGSASRRGCGLGGTLSGSRGVCRCGRGCTALPSPPKTTDAAALIVPSLAGSLAAVRDQRKLLAGPIEELL